MTVAPERPRSTGLDDSSPREVAASLTVVRPLVAAALNDVVYFDLPHTTYGWQRSFMAVDISTTP